MRGVNTVIDFFFSALPVQIFVTAGRSRWCCLSTEAPTWRAPGTCSTPASWPPTATWSWWPWTTGSACSVSDRVNQTARITTALTHPCQSADITTRSVFSFSFIALRRTHQTQNNHHAHTCTRQFLSADSSWLSRWWMTSIEFINLMTTSAGVGSWVLTFLWISFVDYSSPDTLIMVQYCVAFFDCQGFMTGAWTFAFHNNTQPFSLCDKWVVLSVAALLSLHFEKSWSVFCCCGNTYHIVIQPIIQSQFLTEMCTDKRMNYTWIIK